MDGPALTGSDVEFDALVEWLSAMAALRGRLVHESSFTQDADTAERTRLLVRRLRQAENRLRAVVGLAPLM